MLAHLRCGHTNAQLTAGFGVGTTTAYRYITEAVDLPAAVAQVEVREATPWHGPMNCAAADL